MRGNPVLASAASAGGGNNYQLAREYVIVELFTGSAVLIEDRTAGLALTVHWGDLLGFCGGLGG
jgi:hypothetical protein